MPILRYTITLVFLILPATAMASSACTLFVLQRQNDALHISSIPLTQSETYTLSLTPNSGNLALLMPFGLGKSGEVVQRARQPESATIRCANGTLQATYHWPNDRTKALPEVAVATWATYDMRINVTAFDGRQQAFWIRAGQEVAHADGPILDMFGGQIPLQTGDYAITTEVTPHAQLALLSGSAPLVFDGAHFFVEVVQPGQAPQTWIVDLGATGSVVAASALPEGATVRRLEQVEHSASGSETTEGTLEGFGGTIEGFLGRSILPRIQIGSVQVEDLAVGVLDALPNIGKRNPVGILGLDVLRRADVLVFDRSTPNASITWGWQSQVTDPALEAPFSLAYGHVFAAGSINDQPATILLDTGARLSFIAPALMKTAQLTSDPTQTHTVSGLDGARYTVEAVPDVRLRLGTSASVSASFYTGPVPVLAGIGLEDDGVLLGNDWLGTFKQLEFDFSARRLRLSR